MSIRFLARASQSQKNGKRLSPILSALSRSFSQSQSTLPSFGIAFDIDGVVLRGETPIGGSPQALRRLYHHDVYSGALKIPYIFLTNGGGFRESKRALELSDLLGVHISPSQVVQGHSPFKQLVDRFENELVVAVGKGEPAAVMSEYGYKNVISIDDCASCFENIDPLLPYKKWTTKQVSYQNSTSKERDLRNNIHSQRVQAVFIVSDSVDWSRDIQGAFPAERLGLGAFRIALESVFNKIHPDALEYTTYGKPNPFVFKNAETLLKQLVQSLHQNVNIANHANAGNQHLETLYMIGDNPSVDIYGARQAGHPWFSILTRTGVFKGKDNHPMFPADLVVDTVEEAVDYILRKECTS
ncbi:HAD-superfamily hydrolase, subfamily IIA, CECR [Parasponia andersonii]|uniref:HAD-superfamily hydrolase, subfamily IIA, CECR n=1 Tax=Parasponia andersonii TaxID=3476 RepID=A0A2P5CMU8_PARAD|nr:HAD-superfamily hydrolase, subfamily IIA, CECR [Parasponia andersonii]